MKSLNGMEKTGLVMALIFIGFGIYSIVHPVEIYVSHPGPARYGRLIGGEPAREHVTKNGARIRGIISIAVGGGLAWIVFYPVRKR